MLDGLARMRGMPPQRRLRVGVRPKQVRQLIDATFNLMDPYHANVATALEVTQAAKLQERVKQSPICLTENLRLVTFPLAAMLLSNVTSAVSL